MSGVLADTSALARARNPVVAKTLAALRNEGKLWTCDIVTLELGYAARSHVEWLAIHSVQRRLPSAAITASVTRRAAEVQGLLAATGHHRLSLPELLIAAAAESELLEVVHYDKDYDAIMEVTGQPTSWIAQAGSLE